MPILILLTLSISTVSGAFVGHFLVSKPATVSIVENSFEIEVYEDVALTTVATSVGFPFVIKGDISGGTTANSQIYYIHEVYSSVVRVTWECTNLPNEMSLTAERNYNGEWLVWDQGVRVGLMESNPMVAVKFKLDVGNTLVGDYSFTIRFIAGED